MTQPVWLGSVIKLAGETAESGSMVQISARNSNFWKYSVFQSILLATMSVKASGEGYRPKNIARKGNGLQGLDIVGIVEASAFPGMLISRT
jgi:hypothetical protein